MVAARDCCGCRHHSLTTVAVAVAVTVTVTVEGGDISHSLGKFACDMERLKMHTAVRVHMSLYIRLCASVRFYQLYQAPPLLSLTLTPPASFT